MKTPLLILAVSSALLSFNVSASNSCNHHDCDDDDNKTSLTVNQTVNHNNNSTRTYTNNSVRTTDNSVRASGGTGYSNSSSHSQGGNGVGYGGAGGSLTKSGNSHNQNNLNATGGSLNDSGNGTGYGGNATGGSVGDTTSSSVTGDSESNSDSKSNSSNGDQTTNVDASTNHKKGPAQTAVAMANGECGTAFGAQEYSFGLSVSWTGAECMQYLIQKAICPSANDAVANAVAVSLEYNNIASFFQKKFEVTVNAAYDAAREQMITCGAITRNMDPNEGDTKDNKAE
jgi:hypothetical protein